MRKRFKNKGKQAPADLQQEAKVEQPEGSSMPAFERDYADGERLDADGMTPELDVAATTEENPAAGEGGNADLADGDGAGEVSEVAAEDEIGEKDGVGESEEQDVADLDANEAPDNVHDEDKVEDEGEADDAEQEEADDAADNRADDESGKCDSEAENDNDETEDNAEEGLDRADEAEAANEDAPEDEVGEAGADADGAAQEDGTEEDDERVTDEEDVPEEEAEEGEEPEVAEDEPEDEAEDEPQGEGEEEAVEDDGLLTDVPEVEEGPKTVAESIQAEDFMRFGVDPERDKKKEKKKGPSIFQLLNVRNLKTSVEKYGYKFSAKKFFLFIFLAFCGAIGTGLVFQLDWYFIAIIGIIAGMTIPSLVLASLKGMYSARQFHDISDYMEQLLYSFRKKRKILPSLEDVYVIFEDDNSPMRDLVGQAIEYIRTAETDGDIYREALDIIEKEYSNDRLRSVHNFLIAVENYGGKVENSVDLLLDERSMWDERVHLFQKEKTSIKRDVLVSVIFSLIMSFAVLFLFSVETLADLHIPKHMLVQISSTIVILLNWLLFVGVTNKFTQSWLVKENKQTKYQIMKDYFYVKNYDPVKERKYSLIWTACTSVIWIVGLVLGNPFVVIAGAAISAFCLFSSQLSYNLAKKSTAKEIQKAFPQWMMELALLLQTDNVQVSIWKSLETAPAVLRPELELLVEKFEESPHSLRPYAEFLDGYDLYDIKSAMKMLYSVSTSGTGNIGEQIADLIKKQNSLMDKAEKITNNDALAGMSSINMVPMLFCILKSVVDMTVLVFSLFDMLAI